MRKTIARNVPAGTICRYRGWWGVLVTDGNLRHRYRFDAWDTGPFALRDSDEVEVPEPRKATSGA